MSRQKIGEAWLILAAGLLSANVLQIVKLMIVSAYFGVSRGVLDKYFVSLDTVLTFQGIIIGTLQVTFIPLYVSTIAGGEAGRAQRLLSGTMGFGLAFYGLLYAVLFVYARPISRGAAMGFTEQEVTANVTLFRILLMYLFFSGVSELIAAFYNANKRYLLPSFAPVASLLISMVYLVVFRGQGVYALIYGHIWGTFVQLLILAFGARRWGGFRLAASWGFLSREFVPLYIMMLPMAVNLAMGHANIIVDQTVATTLGEAKVTVLKFATRMNDVVVKLFVISIGSAVLPYLSQYAAERRFGELRSTLNLGVRLSLMLLSPVTILVWVFGGDLYAILFQRGELTAHDSQLIGRVWTGYSIGLVFTASAIFASRFLNALQDLHPLWIAGAFGIPLNYLLDRVFSRQWDVFGISIGTSCVYLFYLVFYGLYLRRVFRKAGAPAPLLSPLWKTLTAIILCACAGALLRHHIHPVLDLGPLPTALTRWRSFGLLTLGSLAIVSLYASCLIVLKVNEVGTVGVFLSRIAQKLRLSRAMTAL